MIVGAAEIRITPNSTGFQADLENQVNSTLSAVGATASRTVSDAFKLTGVGVLAGGAAIGASLAGYAGFEQTLNLLRATSHATATQLAAASTQAKVLGADLTLPATSAADAAKAMTELARGGLDVTNAMNAAKGALQLAAAASVDVADSSLIVAKNINAFHLQGTDATKVVDVLTGAFTHSGVSLDEFAGGLANAAAVAGNLGITLPDTAAAIALLTKNGLDASSAGTQLREVLVRLGAAHGAAADEVKKLGISIFDSKGKLLPFRDILDLLSTSTAKLTKEQQLQAFSVIFGQRAQNAATIFATQGVAAYDAMAQALNVSGQAADIAGARMKGLSGTLEGIKSQVETVGISFGQVLAPAAQGILTELTGVSSELTDFGDAVSGALTPGVVHQYAEIIIGDAKRVGDAFHGIEGPAIGVATAIGSGFANQIPIIQAFVPEVAIASGVILGVVAQSDKARDALGHFGGSLIQVGKEQVPVVLDALREVNDAVGPAFAALIDGADKAAVILGPVLGTAIKDLAGPVSDFITQAGRVSDTALPEIAHATAGVAPAVTAVLGGALSVAAEALKLLADNADIAVPAIVGIGGAFATIKLVGFVSDLSLVKRAVTEFQVQTELALARVATAQAAAAAQSIESSADEVVAVDEVSLHNQAAAKSIQASWMTAALGQIEAQQEMIAANQVYVASTVETGVEVVASVEATATETVAASVTARAALGTIGAGVGGLVATAAPLAVLAVGIGLVTKHFSDQAAEAAAARRAVQGYADAIGKAATATAGVNAELGRTLTDGSTKFTAFGLSGDKVNELFQQLNLSTADVSVGLLKSGDAFKVWLADVDASAKASGADSDAIKILNLVLIDMADKAKKGAKAAADRKDVIKDSTQADRDAASAIDNETRSVNDLASATLAAIDANIRSGRDKQEATRSIQDQTKAQQDLLKVLADPAATRQDAIAAQRSYEDATSRVSDSLRTAGADAVDTAQKQAVLEGKTKDSVNVFSTYKQGVIDAAKGNDQLALAGIAVISQFDATAEKAPIAGHAAGDGYTAALVDGLDPAKIQAGLDGLLGTVGSPAQVASAKAAGIPVGKGLGEGVADGISLATQASVSAAINLIGAIQNASITHAQIKSPSKLMADTVGKPLGLGVAEGIKAAFPDSVAAGAAVIAAVLAGMRQDKATIQAELKSIGDQIQEQVATIRGTSQSLVDAARVSAGVAAAIPFPELVALEVAKRVKDAQGRTTSDAIEKTIQEQVNAQLASQGIAGTGAGAQDPKALFWISVNGTEQLFQGTEAQAIAKAKELGGLETPIIQGFNDPAARVAREQAGVQATADAASALAHLQQQEFNHQLISSQEFLTDLNAQLAKLQPLTDDYFSVLDQITAVNKSITDAAAQASQAQSDALDAVLHREQLMYEHQMLAADQFLADLQQRMGQVSQFSDQWFSLLDEVKQVQADQAKALAANTVGKTFLVQVDNNGQNLDETRLAQLLERTARVTPDAFASIG